MQSPTHADPNRVADLRRGQQVIAHNDVAVGDVLGIVTRDGASYMHVRRYGPGMDEVFIPTIAVRQIVGNHVYLTLDAMDLLGEPWHQSPVQAETSRPRQHS